MIEGDLAGQELTVDEHFYVALLEDDPEELYEAAPCAYLSTLPDGLIVKANRTFSTWTGYERAELVGRRRLHELLAPGDRIFYETHLAPMLRMQGAVREIAAEIVCRGGGRLPVVLNAALARGDGERPAVIRAALFDARERRAYELELLDARRRAEASEARAVALARTLQATFIPPSLPEVEGLDLAGTYRPAGDGSEVGGDFYDVFETPRRTWSMVLGDVAGKGASAAVLTALARSTVRTESLRVADPAAVLVAVHDALVHHHPDRFVTAVQLDVRPVEHGAHVVVASGGHPRPLHVRPERPPVPVGHSGRILGMLDRPKIRSSAVHLRPGEALVLFTDGVVEARRAGELFGDERLHALLASLAGEPARRIVDGVVEEVLAFQHGNASDDIAVLCVCAPPTSPF